MAHQDDAKGKVLGSGWYLLWQDFFFCLNPHLSICGMFLLMREREREKHWWFASCKCSYWGPNLQPPFSAQDDAPTNWATWPGCARQDACQGQWEKGTVSRQPGFGRTGDRGDDLQPHSGSPFPFCLLYLVSISVYLLQGESQASPSLQGLSLFGDLKKKNPTCDCPIHHFTNSLFTLRLISGEKSSHSCACMWHQRMLGIKSNKDVMYTVTHNKGIYCQNVYCKMES